MGLTTALNTSLNGLQLNETAIEVIGNNIANAATNGYKASAVQFTTQLSRTLSVGSAPQGQNGGTNPRQVGLGSTTAAIRRDFSQGAITTSTSPSDLAIEGEGFFVLSGADGQVYTRNGNFTLNNQSQLVNADGLRVKGYGIDDQFNIVTTLSQGWESDRKHAQPIVKIGAKLSMLNSLGEVAVGRSNYPYIYPMGNGTAYR